MALSQAHIGRRAPARTNALDTVAAAQIITSLAGSSKIDTDNH